MGQESELRDQMSPMLDELDYFRRGIVRFRNFSEEIADTLNYASNHIFSHFWIDRQRQDPGLVEVGGRKVFRNVAEISVGGIKWQRFRIVQNRGDTCLGKMLSSKRPGFPCE